MALNTAYDSKITKRFDKAALILAIEKGHHTAENTPTMMGDSIKLVTEDYEVTPLPYPLYDGERRIVYVDVRGATSLDRNHNLKVRNQPEMEFLEHLAKLELNWVGTDKTETLMSGYTYTNDIFINWLSELIAYRLGLSPIHAMRLKALTAFYIVGQFDNHAKKSELERYGSLLSRKFAVNIDVVYEVLDQLDGEVPTNIDEYIDAFGKVELGPRVKGFSSRALYQFINGSFFGVSNHLTYVSVALEYPPAFAAICLLAEKYRFIGKSGIGQKVVDTNKRQRTTVLTSLKSFLA